MRGWAMAASRVYHLDAELAGELRIARVPGLQRFIVPSQLHYPQSWIPIAQAMRQGILIGKASPPLFALPLHELLHLTPGEARARLGTAGWTAVDTRAASHAYGEPAVPPATE